jgi:hypothetical protein
MRVASGGEIFNASELFLTVESRFEFSSQLRKEAVMMLSRGWSYDDTRVGGADNSYHAGMCVLFREEMFP